MCPWKNVHAHIGLQLTLGVWALFWAWKLSCIQASLNMFYSLFNQRGKDNNPNCHSTLEIREMLMSWILCTLSLHFGKQLWSNMISFREEYLSETWNHIHIRMYWTDQTLSTKRRWLRGDVRWSERKETEDSYSLPFIIQVSSEYKALVEGNFKWVTERTYHTYVWLNYRTHDKTMWR